jgi:hypothetical protein
MVARRRSRSLLLIARLFVGFFFLDAVCVDDKRAFACLKVIQMGASKFCAIAPANRERTLILL